MSFNWKHEAQSWLVIGFTFISAIFFYSDLPNPMPIHWNVAGQPDGYTSPLVGVFLMPCLMVGVYLLLLFLIYKHYNLKSFLFAVLGVALTVLLCDRISVELFKEFSIVYGRLDWNNYDLCFSIEDLYEGKIE